MAQKEWELISERTRAALAAARAKGRHPGRGSGVEAAVAAVRGCAAAQTRREEAERTAHRLLLEVEVLRTEGVVSHQGLARGLTERGVPTPRGGAVWTHTTVARVLERSSP